MTPAVAYAIALAAAVIAGWLMPALVMRFLGPSLAATRFVPTNYRGRPVFLGLGLVWVVWAVTLLTASTLLDAIGMFVVRDYDAPAAALFDGPLTMPLYAVPLILVVVAALLGLTDDVFGTPTDKGFRGHLSALSHGRLTTGGLKLLGIGLASAAYGWRVAVRGVSADGVIGTDVFGWWVAATLVIALSANLLNLTDLRPGRALKTYSVLAVGAGVPFALAAVATYSESPGMTWTATDTAVTVACMLIVLLGPVLAVWRYDLGERGMLGDAGSNAMGAIVGYLFAGSLPLEWLVALAVVLLALNVASEKVSFSSVIEAVGPLRWLDQLGRREDDGTSDGNDAQPPS